MGDAPRGGGDGPQAGRRGDAEIRADREGDDVRPGRAGLRAYHVLALLPPVAMLGGIPFANRAEPYVLGLPFLLFWILAWVVGTSAVLALIYGLDRRRAARGEPLP